MTGGSQILKSVRSGEEEAVGAGGGWGGRRSPILRCGLKFGCMDMSVFWVQPYLLLWALLWYAFCEADRCCHFSCSRGFLLGKHLGISRAFLCLVFLVIDLEETPACMAVLLGGKDLLFVEYLCAPYS